MAKRYIFVVSALVACVTGVEWYVFKTEKIVTALLLGVGAFSGFYASEIAKKAVRARQVANQTWTYVTNLDVTIKFEKLNELPFEAERKEWIEEISRANFDRAEIDKKYGAKVFAHFDDQDRLTNSVNFFAAQKSVPGRIDRIMGNFEYVQEQLNSWNKYLSDEDIALLGPDILFEVITLRSSQMQMISNLKMAYGYIKDAENINPIHIKNEMQRFIYYLMRTQVALEKLKVLANEAKARGLWQHTLALFGRI